MSHKLAKLIKYNKHNYQASKSASSKYLGRRLGDRLLLPSGIANVATGTFAGLILAALTPVFLSSIAQAKPYSMTVTIDNSVIDMNVSPSKHGSFSKSSNSTVSVSTTNASGYTLSIASSGRNDGRLVNSSDNGSSSNDGTNGNNYLSSIDSAITEEQFKTLPSDGSESSYNNQWAYLPSMWDGQANTLFRPSPTKAGDVLDHTTTANPEANKYTLAIGARVDTTQRIGSYSNTYVVLATANGTPYTITYKDDTISNFPTDESATAEGDKVAISNLTPVKDGYTFLGWCAGTTSTSKVVHNANGTDTCNGTSYTAGDTWTIDQTIENNNLVLYAMWGGNYTIDAFIAGGGTMQDFATMDTDQKSKIVATMPTGTQYQLIDNRDNTKYWIAKQADGKIWMTQNLDLCVGCTGTAALTSENTDLNTYGSGAYVTDYSMTNGVITWTPGTNGSPITSSQTAPASDGSMTWSNTQVYPWSAEGGNVYVYTSGTTANDTISTNCNTENDYCKHSHRGNYYNWTEAIASSDSTSLVAGYATAENSICPAGWRLPRGQSSNTSTASTRESGQLLSASGVTKALVSDEYTSDGFILIRKDPLFLVRGGVLYSGGLHSITTEGFYWSSTVHDDSYAYNSYFTRSHAHPATRDTRRVGQALRCLLR